MQAKNENGVGGRRHLRHVQLRFRLEDSAVRLGGGLRSGIGADARGTPTPRVLAYADDDSPDLSVVVSYDDESGKVAPILSGAHPDVSLSKRDGGWELRGLSSQVAVAVGVSRLDNVGRSQVGCRVLLTQPASWAR